MRHSHGLRAAAASSIGVSVGDIFGASTSGAGINAWPVGTAGVGTKYADPAVTAPAAYSIAYNSVTNSVALAINGSPGVVAYAWNPGSGVGAKFSNPATAIPTSGGFGGRSIKFTPDGSYVFIGSGESPWINAYNWSASGFGTKFSNPATALVGQVNYLAVSPSSDAVLFAGGGNGSTIPYIGGYKWSASGFGTKYSNPGGWTTSWGCNFVDFHPAGTAVLAGGNDSPFVHAWPWTQASGFGTKYTAISGTTHASPYGQFAPDGNSVFFIQNKPTSTLHQYGWSSGFGTELTSLAASPNTSPFGLLVTNSLVFRGTSAGINVYSRPTSTTLAYNYDITAATAQRHLALAPAP